MGRPRKPLAVLEISGATRKNPQRYRARKAAALQISAGLGDPPNEWVEGAEHNGRFAAYVKIWNEIVAQDAIGLKVLNASHRLLVKNMCQLQYKIDRAGAGYGKATSGDWAQLLKGLEKLGQTPIDSIKVADAVRIPERSAGSGGRGAGGPGWGELVG